jgi:hypothetical protein
MDWPWKKRDSPGILAAREAAEILDIMGVKKNTPTGKASRAFAAFDVLSEHCGMEMANLINQAKFLKDNDAETLDRLAFQTKQDNYLTANPQEVAPVKITKKKK